jgi:hypothetical protein
MLMRTAQQQPPDRALWRDHLTLIACLASALAGYLTAAC